MSARDHMRAAIGLGMRHAGQTWPNPSVGCVIVDAQGRVAGRGVTGIGGRPHAEVAALALAGERARGGIAYVTLEPCAHRGVTPPCAEALVAAGVSRVVAACGDPDPRVDGRGFARLRAAGIAVETGLLCEEAGEGLLGFVTRVRRSRPAVTLKLAATLDGRIATASGVSRWITGPASRREVHRMRAGHDAVMVGIGTVLADDPALDCRLAGARVRPPVRVVLDRRLRLDPASRLARDARTAPVWVVHGRDVDGERRDRLIEAGVLCLEAQDGGGIEGALACLGARGLTSVLAEGGAMVAASLLRAGLADRIAWFVAPFALGDDARAAVGPLDAGPLAEVVRHRRVGARAIGDDMLIELAGRDG